MQRKLVKQGTATLMVSLPSKWTKANNLDKGSEVNIEEDGKSLHISTVTAAKKKETTIKLASETESSIRTLITSAYRLGYDKVHIIAQTKNVIKIVRQITKNLLGFEVISEKNNECIIENITEPSQHQFDTIFHKVLLNIEELFTIARKNLQGENETFRETEEKILEFDNFCRRVLAKNKPHDNYQLQWGFHTSLNHAQREIYHLLVYLEKNKIKKEKEILHLLAKAEEMFQLLKQAYLTKNISFIEKIHEKEKEIIYQDGYAVLKKVADPIIVYHCLNVVRNIYLASSPLTGVIVSIKN